MAPVPFLAKVRQKEKQPRETPFTGIEQLIEEARLDFLAKEVPRQQPSSPKGRKIERDCKADAEASALFGRTGRSMGAGQISYGQRKPALKAFKGRGLSDRRRQTLMTVTERSTRFYI
jgi:hypothetical protein